MDKSNSFYYFFSATPQVLAGLLAVYGFFIVYKMQIVKDDLISLGQTILNILENDISKRVNKTMQNSKIIEKLQSAIDDKNINKISLWISYIEIEDHKRLEKVKTRFNEKAYQSRKLIQLTLAMSILIALNILFCLSMIPVGGWLFVRPVLLVFSYYLPVASIAVCCVFFVRILQYSLDDKEVLSYLVKNKSKP